MGSNHDESDNENNEQNNNMNEVEDIEDSGETSKVEGDEEDEGDEGDEGEEESKEEGRASRKEDKAENSCLEDEIYESGDRKKRKLIPSPLLLKKGLVEEHISEVDDDEEETLPHFPRKFKVKSKNKS